MRPAGEAWHRIAMSGLSASREISTGDGPHTRRSAKGRHLITGSPARGGGRAVIMLTAPLLPDRRSWPGESLPPARPARAVPGLVGSAGPAGRGSRPTGPSLGLWNGYQLLATILPSRPFDSPSGPAEKSSSLVFAAFPLPNLRPHRPSMTIGWPLACRSWPRRAPLLGS